MAAGLGVRPFFPRCMRQMSCAGGSFRVIASGPLVRWQRWLGRRAAPRGEPRPTAGSPQRSPGVEGDGGSSAGGCEVDGEKKGHEPWRSGRVSGFTSGRGDGTTVTVTGPGATASGAAPENRCHAPDDETGRPHKHSPDGAGVGDTRVRGHPRRGASRSFDDRPAAVPFSERRRPAWGHPRHEDKGRQGFHGTSRHVHGGGFPAAAPARHGRVGRTPSGLPEDAGFRCRSWVSRQVPELPPGAVTQGA